jgi:penicillin-binding protein 1C
VRLVAFLLLAVLTVAQAGEPPRFADVRAQSRSSEAWLLDRHGEPLQRLRLDPHARQLDWVELTDMSPALLRAILESEDRRFFAHAGVDWLAIAAGAWQTVRGGTRRGASTVPMQLAALLDPELGGEAGGRSIARKWRQIRAALALDATWRKEEILEAYLNLVPFRGEAIGISAASQAYFGKHPGGLDRRESTLAAALVRSPAAAPTVVAKRACVLLKRQDAAADCDGLAYFADARLRHPLPVESRPADAPHLARRLLASPGDTVTSTLDARLQRFVRETLQRQLRELARRNVMDGAALVVDNATGEVLAWVGGSGELSESPHVDAVSALRQAGSTLKPFLYAQAIEGRWITAASILDDSPLSVTTGGGLYVPQNYDRSFRGAVSVRTALASSLNVPAVRTLGMVSPESFRQRLRVLGFDSLRESGDFYGYSLALGSADVSLAMLANAYRTLANGGR